MAVVHFQVYSVKPRSSYGQEVIALPEVYCSVANCYFWDEGNVCGADAIMVEVNARADRQFDEEVGGEMINTSNQEYTARHSRDTCCHTFRPKR